MDRRAIDALLNAAASGDGDAALVLHDALLDESASYVAIVETAESFARSRGDIWMVAVQRIGDQLLFTTLSPPDLNWTDLYRFGRSSIASPVGRPSSYLLGLLNTTTSVRRGQGRPKEENGPIALTYFTKTYT